MTHEKNCIHSHEKAKAKSDELLQKLMRAYESCHPDEVTIENHVTLVRQDKFKEWLSGFPGKLIASLAATEYFIFLKRLALQEGINCGCTAPKQAVSFQLTESPTIH